MAEANIPKTSQDVKRAGCASLPSFVSERRNMARAPLIQFLKACSLCLYFPISQMLDAKDTEIFNSPFGGGVNRRIDLMGCLDLEDEDIERLTEAMEAGDPEMFRSYIRNKYGLEHVYNYEDYQHYLDRQERRKQRRKGLSPRLVLEVFRRDGFKCKACGKSENLTLDHIIPYIEGGEDLVSNLQTLCQECNSSKGARV